MRDECMAYIVEAQRNIDQMEDISLYAAIFEAGDEESESFGDKAIAAMQRALKAVQNIFKAIRDAIQNAFGYASLSKEDRAAYDKFAATIKQDPALAKTQVTVKNWKLIERSYDGLMKEVEAEIKRTKEEEASDLSIIKKLKSKMGDLAGIAQKSAIKVTLNEVLKMAEQDKEIAKNLKFALDNDLGMTDRLAAELNNKEISKFKKKVNSLNKKISLYRIKASLRKWLYKEKEKDIATKEEYMKKFAKEIGTEAGKSILGDNKFEQMKSLHEINKVKRSDIKDKKREMKSTGKEAKAQMKDANKKASTFVSDVKAAEQQKAARDAAKAKARADREKRKEDSRLARQARREEKKNK